MHLAVPLAKGNLPKLATKKVSSILDKIERKISWQGSARVEKEFTLFILNEYVDNVIKILESLEKSVILINSKTWNRKRRMWIFFLLWWHQ